MRTRRRAIRPRESVREQSPLMPGPTHAPPRSPLIGARRALVLAAAAFCLTPWASPALGLALGAALALCGLTAFPAASARSARTLIQVCVVLLGFGMDLGEVARAGAAGALFAAGTILATFALALPIGRLLRLEPRLTILLASGTSICGGSAVAATGAVIGASSAEMSVAIAAVFLLNAAALYLFPILGHALDLSQHAFGTWAAVAIHDVSSVVAAAGHFGDEAQRTAVAVKLSRALWIVPVSLASAWLARHMTGGASKTGPAAAPTDAPSGERPGSAPSPDTAARAPRRPSPVPVFIMLFVAASAARTLAERLAPGADWLPHSAAVLHHTAKAGMSLALFLVGTGLSVAMLRAVGWRALVLAIGLWVAISAGSLAVIVSVGS